MNEVQTIHGLSVLLPGDGRRLAAHSTGARAKEEPDHDSLHALQAWCREAGAGSPVVDALLAAHLRIGPPNAPEWLLRMDTAYTAARGRVFTNQGHNWKPQPFTSDVGAAMTAIPHGWWLEHVGEDRTRIRFRGDMHDPVGTFTARLQHVLGGLLCEFKAATMPCAILGACIDATETWHRYLQRRE